LDNDTTLFLQLLGNGGELFQRRRQVVGDLPGDDFFDEFQHRAETREETLKG